VSHLGRVKKRGSGSVLIEKEKKKRGTSGMFGRNSTGLTKGRGVKRDTAEHANPQRTGREGFFGIFSSGKDLISGATVASGRSEWVGKRSGRGE